MFSLSSSKALPVLALPVLFSVLALATPSCSPSSQERAPHIFDKASVLDDETAENMSQRLAEFEKETCHRIKVLVLQTFEGNNLADYSAQVMKERNIAPPPLESGLLMTVVITEGKARIDAGKGLQDIVNSGRADAILKTGAFPFFVEEKYGEGIVRALMLLMNEGRAIIYPDELRPEYCR